MSCVMLIGYGPLPQPGAKVFNSACLRTLQFLRGLREAGHTVFLYTLPLPGSGLEEEEADMFQVVFEDLEIWQLTVHSGEFAVTTLNEEVRRLQPDALVGVTTYPSYIAAMLTTTTPMWADLGGFWMAEMQGKCFADEDDVHLLGGWNVERSILRRADKFSAVSRNHVHAVIGEMAALARMNQYTFSYQFGAEIPHAGFRLDKLVGDGAASKATGVRGTVVPDDAFMVLWSGSFTPWSDVSTLVRAMNALMENYPEVHFVSTGGELPILSERTFGNFSRAIAASPHKDRFHHLGWVPAERLPVLYKEADIGINVDDADYATFFGARMRLTTMAASGLPILTTIGTEFSEWLEDSRACLPAKMGDSKSVVEGIEAWIEQREKLQDYARRAKKLVEDQFTPAKTMRTLLQWVKNPRNAPDNEEKIKQAGAGLTTLQGYALSDLEEHIMLLEGYTPTGGTDSTPTFGVPKMDSVWLKIKGLWGPKS